MATTRELLTAFILVTALFCCEGKLGVPSSSNRRDEEAAAPKREEGSPPNEAAKRRHLACTDYEGMIRYRIKYSTSTTQCKNLANQAMRGVDIAPKCERDLVALLGSDMDDFWNGAKVSDACPVSCGVSCDDSRPTTPTPIRDDSRPTTPTPTQKPDYPEKQDTGAVEFRGRGRGEWGETFDMKLIPIHAMVLPRGNLLEYGTNAKGRQGGDLYYEVWDYFKGTQRDTHRLLKHYTKADTFCSTLSIDPSTGNVMIMGGDTREPGNAGGGINTVLEYNPRTDEVRKHPKGNMHYARWYGTSVNLPNGDIFVVGGRDEDKKGSPIPELWTPRDGFRELRGAKVPAIAQERDKNHWWYPHVFINSSGHIIVIMPRKNNADVYRVDVKGDGDIERIGKKPFEAHVRSLSIMYRIDKVMMLDDKGGLWVVDISGRTPQWKKMNDIGSGRTNGAASMLPDGRVAITGGASSTNDGGSDPGRAVYDIQIWDPDTNKVSNGRRQKFARLYHSISLILPDNRLLSAGGGAPGPYKHRNGQIYEPDYLFTANQEKAVRPRILDCPKNVETSNDFVITVDDTSMVKQVTATKSGANSHTRNCDTRWIDLKFEILNDSELRVYTEGPNTMITGLWLLSTINKNGTPSVASFIGVNMVPLD